MFKVFNLVFFTNCFVLINCLDGFIKQDSIICGQNTDCRIAATFENIHKVDVNINCAEATNQNVYNRFANISKIVWNGCEAHNSLELNHISDKTSVKFLQIENFILVEIPKLSFKGLKNVETLIILNCFVQNIWSDSFDELKSLKFLNITGNTIRSVHSKVLDELNHLESLVIEDKSNFNLNLINFNNDQVLENLTSKSNSRLFNEKIGYIFEHVKNVELQSISQEQIIVNEGLSNSTIESFSYTKSFINEVYLDSINSLKFLNLSGNIINHNRLRLYSLGSLEVLDLSQNSIGYVEELFLELPSLRTLDLKSNSIKTVSESSFSNLQNLEKVILVDNDLRDFDIEWHLNAVNVKFYIDENFFDCSKLVEINRNQPEIFRSLIYTKNINSLNINFLKCENYPDQHDDSQTTTETPKPLKMEDTTTAVNNSTNLVKIHPLTLLFFILISIALGFLLSQLYLLMYHRYKLNKHQPFYRLLVRESQDASQKNIQSRKLPSCLDYEAPLENSTNIVYNNFYEEIPEN